MRHCVILDTYVSKGCGNVLIIIVAKPAIRVKRSATPSYQGAVQAVPLLCNAAVCDGMA